MQAIKTLYTKHVGLVQVIEIISTSNISRPTFDE